MLRAPDLDQQDMLETILIIVRDAHTIFAMFIFTSGEVGRRGMKFKSQD